MKLVLLDGGGTSLKLIYYINNVVTITKEFGPSNIGNNYELTKNNVFEALDYLKIKIGQEIDSIFILISLAGAYSNQASVVQLESELKNKFKNKIIITSDILFHYAKHFLDSDGTIINLGTGTSIIEQKQKIKHLLFGYGKNFLEPGNGYTIALNLFKYLSYVEVYNKESSLLEEFKQKLGIDELRKVASNINKMEVNELASYAKWLLELPLSAGLKKELTIILDKSFEQIFDYLKLNQCQKIKFAGSIAKNNLVQDLLKKFHNNLVFDESEIYLIEDIWNMLLV